MKDFFTVLGVFFVGFLLGCLLTFLSLLPSKYVQGAEIQKDRSEERRVGKEC